MAEWVSLKAGDGHELQAYVARPTAEPKAALVIVQEIFGVNAHIRSVTDQFADLGFLAVAPAMFDRYERGFDVGYDEAGWARAKEILSKLNLDWAILDVAAAVKYLQSETDSKIGIVGYCFGGSVAWLAAARVSGLSAAVGYYGRLALQYIDEKPAVPTIMHFGDKDESIPTDGVEKLRVAHPEVAVYRYAEAGHAFNRAGDPHYVATAAELALERTLEHFKKYLER